jgi:hypothetical protein
MMSEGIVAASNTIYPGMLVIFSAGFLVPSNAAADVDSPRVFAFENENFGEDLNTPYTQGDTCYILYPHAGALIYGYLETGATVAAGAPLESNGAGLLQPLTTGRIIGFAEEALNNSGGGAGPAGSTRIRVRVA